ncbi:MULTISPECIES: class I SAM-dependent RNA methyltransferase [Mammaliicoccus]|uniref:THUMP domain-containing class I SAM-dependent RNA methyltransferase n=1 Tax=Mammaliicoccus TaxID=2803850 RepID=UPI000D1C2A0C|nr:MULTISPECIES: class I SAM-dependent RNA methyltransferase [Mammaliicoccus]MBW0763967.1 class I SAM-dependent RNA methyltransferase [Mammaliicoccus fleurettii]MEB6200582.1 class I SAM-dependent RNA methyltransferase [Mammaliicoccus fleurettii]MEB7807420.1 class I SAM-dependent RNA methyltransferase [Mammaliicoccus fleurettii]PTE33425.1 RNA methyltransferase [Mammaliicoccus fleurettii]RIL47447.1 class I SAM-dependent RNA methyltransferase [Mammaliicoccus fleurettii]
MYQLLATSPMGLESIVAKEVQELGYETTVENGRVLFEGDEKAIVKANLWLRTADRVKIVVGRFNATTFDELFEKTKSLPWENVIGAQGMFPVQGKSVKSKLFSVSDCQAIVKKAIVERLKHVYSIKGWIDESGSKYQVEVSLLKDEALLTIDTSGSGLHKRGYRLAQGEAPMKETLAAALVRLTNWSGETPFIDPFCGSGTLAIEAALIAQNIAPGFNRSFASEEWDIIPEGLYDQLRQEADEVALYDKEIDIVASDIDPRMVEIAKANAVEVGLGDIIKFTVQDVHDLVVPEGPVSIIGNPPYGERIGERSEVEAMYKHLGEILNKNNQVSLYMLTSYKEFEPLVGTKATKRRKLFNGYIECTYYQYWGKRSK